MPQLSIVVAVRQQTRSLHSLVAAAGSGRRPGAIEVLLVDDGAGDALADWQRRHPRVVRALHRPGAAPDRAAAFDAGLAAAAGEWVTFVAGERPLAAGELRLLRRLLRHGAAPSPVLLCLHAEASRTTADRGTCHAPVDALELAPPAHGACFPRRMLQAAGARFEGDLRADFVTTAFLVRYLLAAGDGATLAWPAGAAAPAAPAGPDAAAWALPATYGSALANGALRLFEAAASGGSAPAWLQRTLLLDLQAYLATDRHARAPTAIVSEPLAAGFHDVACRIMAHVDTEVVEQLDPARTDAELRQALLSYLRPEGRSRVAVTAFDRDQGLLRLSWHFRGEPSAETFLIDGEPLTPTYAKRRACRFLRRTLCRERIVWLPVREAGTLEVRIGGERAAVSVGEKPAAAPVLALDAARAALTPSRVALRLSAGGVAGLKARMLRRLARLAPVRRRFAGAWVFVDREAEADDNAEHLYRWTVRHRPEVNAWFLLDPVSPDWQRLEREGFRLMPPGLARRLLLLNCEHLISSQPAHVSGGFDPRLYAGALPWRFTFLQHGVIKDDMSHWLSGQPFDIFVTSSPAEHASIAADDTPYTYTGRETRRTGLPRHDRLLELSRRMPPAGIDTILLMPTWRGRLVAEGATPGTDRAAFRAAFRASEYASSWRALLGSDALRRLAERHGKRLVFMPHPDSAPYLDAFEAPAHVEVATKAATAIQPLFCRSAAMVTDFSSVAFEMAYLRRPVVYFQFDRDRFFAGDHNWREGYFSYERDGFGPVVMTPGEVVRQLDLLLAPGAPALGEYVARMERALPERDGGACLRVFEAVRGIRCRNGVAETARTDSDAPRPARRHAAVARPAGGDEAAVAEALAAPLRRR